jgi:hypothetical protein
VRLAYADPPYPGLAKYYGPTAREVNFPLLIAYLREFDGWALSCGSTHLRQLLPLCPPGVRVGAWTKPFFSFKPGVSPGYAWEPVIFVPARRSDWPRYRDTPIDWCRVSITKQRGLIGAKPEEFCAWVFQMLRAEPEDTLEDLFPGTGAVTRAWDVFQRQITLLRS